MFIAILRVRIAGESSAKRGLQPRPSIFQDRIIYPTSLYHSSFLLTLRPVSIRRIYYIPSISSQHVAILATVAYFAPKVIAIPAGTCAGVRIGLRWPHILIACVRLDASRVGNVWRPSFSRCSCSVVGYPPRTS
jgi:hypothetical protein